MSKLLTQEQKLNSVKSLLQSDNLLRLLSHRFYLSMLRNAYDYLTPRRIREVDKNFHPIKCGQELYQEYRNLMNQIGDKVFAYYQEAEEIRKQKITMRNRIKYSYDANNPDKYTVYEAGRYFKLYQKLTDERNTFLNEIESLRIKKQITHWKDIGTLNVRKNAFMYYITLNGHIFKWTHETDYDWHYYAKSYNHPKITKTTKLYLLCYPGVTNRMDVYRYYRIVILDNKLASTARIAIKSLLLEHMLKPKMIQTDNILNHNRFISRFEILDI